MNSTTADHESQTSRIFIGNLPNECSIPTIEKRFEEYGKIYKVNRFRGFAFVQYKTEEEALEAIKNENNTIFCGKRIDVKRARNRMDDGEFPRKSRPLEVTSAPKQFYQDFGNKGLRTEEPYLPPENQTKAFYVPPPPKSMSLPTKTEVEEKANDCEIFCISKSERAYSEEIEARLRNYGLAVDILFPNPDIPLTKVLASVTSKGVLYAIVINSQNAIHRSLTLNILQGNQQEHRNMPIDDALTLIARCFETHLSTKGTSDRSSSVGNNAPKNGSSHPEIIRKILGFLLEDRPISVSEHDRLIKYLMESRLNFLKEEYGDDIPHHLLMTSFNVQSPKQKEIHDRVMNILKNPKPVLGGDSTSHNVAINPNAQAGVPVINSQLQQAIDSLMKSGPNLLSSVGSQNSMSIASGGISVKQNLGIIDATDNLLKPQQSTSSSDLPTPLFSAYANYSN